MKEVVMPALNMTMSEGVIARWLKVPGDLIRKGEPLVEIETDKAVVEIESPATGILGPTLHPEGTTVAVGSAITSILESDESEAESPSIPPAGAQITPSLEVDGTRAEDPDTHPEAESPRTAHRLSPRARRLAREASMSEDEVLGRHAADVERAIAESPQRQSSHRQLVARRTAEAWREIPHFAVTREVDAERLLDKVTELRGKDIQATVTDVMLQALAAALRAVGIAEGPHVALAISTPGGVVAAVIKDVLSLDAATLAKSRRAVVERARANRLSPEDLEGIAFTTLSNLGALGVDHFTGVISQGQSTLITVGRIRLRPVASGRALTVAPTFFATINADHRELDGADAARLLAAFADHIEAPRGDSE